MPSKLSEKYKPFYNIARSDPQCIGYHDLQSPCRTSKGLAGHCILEESLESMGEEIKENLQIQSHTLRKICMSDGELEKNDGDIWYQKIGYTDTVKCEKREEGTLVAESQDVVTIDDQEVKYVIKSIE